MVALAQEPANEIDKTARTRRHWFAQQKRRQVVRQLGGAGVAMAGAFLQALAADELQIDVDLRIESARAHRFLRANQEERLHRRGGHEGDGQ